MIELTHSLNKKMADRYLYDRYDKFSEENLPSEYFSLDDDSIRVDIPQDETKIKKLMDEVRRNNLGAEVSTAFSINSKPSSFSATSAR